MSPAPVVTDHPERSRYEITVGSQSVGLLTYTLADGVIVLLHAEIDPAHGGQGLGTALARAALEDARARRLRVRPLCPFVVAVIRRHPGEYDELLAR